MKVRYRRRKDGTEEISYHAQTARERVALRNAILAAARDPEGLSQEGVARELEQSLCDKEKKHEP